jgi:hypothetical protein
MNKPSESDVAKHAYHLWEREGRPHGRDQEHWLTAEREILGAATAKEDRPIGEVRSAEQASANPPAARQSVRQTGSAAPGRPAQPASPGVTQAAVSTSKRAPQQAQSEQPGAKQQQGAGKTQSSAARKPRTGSKQGSS